MGSRRDGRPAKGPGRGGMQPDWVMTKPLCASVFFIHKMRGLPVSPLRSLSANFSRKRTSPLAAAVSGFGSLCCTVLPVEQ